MDEFEMKKLTEVILYILHKTRTIDYYHLFKILYFAEREHLAKWGFRITSDTFFALQYGPVPTLLYDAIKGDFQGHELNKILKDAIDVGAEDASNFVSSKRLPNEDYISKSEKEALDNSINENKNLSFDELMNKSHDAAYKEASKKNVGYKCIKEVSMAKAGGAGEGMLEYIDNQMMIDAALQ